MTHFNIVKFEPTHELTMENGETIMVRLVDTAAYQAYEWSESMAAEITYDGSWKKNEKNISVAVKEAVNNREPDDFR